MNDVRSKWIGYKLALLGILMAQFYLAKRFQEPYPCVIMPAFAAAHPKDTPITTFSYCFVLRGEDSIDTLHTNEVLPYLPARLVPFLAPKIFSFSADEKEAFVSYLRQKNPELFRSGPAVLELRKIQKKPERTGEQQWNTVDRAVESTVFSLN